MTDYDFFPPIRFVFDGDTETAKRYIPQARALMNQLIRRMEAGEVDALTWNVRMANGLQVEVSKFGSQHIARIQAPVIVVEEEEQKQGTGDYLWIGVEIDYSNAASYELEGGLGYDYFLPSINAMLFEPGWRNTDSTATVLQSESFNLGKPSASLNSYAFYASYEYTIERPSSTEQASWEFATYILETPNGAYTAYPFVNGGPQNKKVDACIVVDEQTYTKSIADFVDTSNVGGGVHKRTRNAHNYQVIVTSYDSDTNSFGPTSYELITANDAGLSIDYNNRGTVLEGIYELRIATRTLDNSGGYAFGDGESVPCTVYIQVNRDQPLQAYSVSIPSFSEYTPERASRGDFDTKDWFESGQPTQVTEEWYPGCWLIDVKNQTIIHETRPDRLGRPWLIT